MTKEEGKLKYFDVAYLEQITDELLHYKVEPKTIYRGVPIDDFISLVKRMREAQVEKDESEQGYRTIPHICILEKKDRLEYEVDEYLKKFNENI